MCHMDLALGIRLMLAKNHAQNLQPGCTNWAFIFKLMQCLNKTTLIFRSAEQMPLRFISLIVKKYQHV